MKKICRILCLLCFVVLNALNAHAASDVRENTVWYRMHFGMGVGDHALSIDKMRSFIDTNITPHFARGLTVTPAHGQWHSPGMGLVRERTTVIDLFCEDTDANWEFIQQIANDYVERFKAAHTSSFIVRIPETKATLIFTE